MNSPILPNWILKYGYWLMQVECYRIMNVMDWLLEICINWGIPMVFMLNFPQEPMKSPYPQFINLWSERIVERWISWVCACSNWTIWIMLLSMSNVVILDVLTNNDIWSLKGKLWEFCMIMIVMYMLYEYFENNVIITMM